MMMFFFTISPKQRVRFFFVGLVIAFFVGNSGFVATAEFVPTEANYAIGTAERSLSLRLMSWNSLFMNSDIDAFRAALHELQPDVIAIQEIGMPITEELLANWQSTYPYMELYPTGTPAGLGVVSRFPFHAVTLPDFDEETGCNCQIVTLAVEGTTVTLINAHPWPPEIEFTVPKHWSSLLALNTAKQDPIFAQLMAKIEAVEGPLLVAGDLNTMPFQPNVARLQTRLTDAFVEAGEGMGYTFPADGTAYNLPSIPFMRIDYILHSDEWHATSTHTGTISGSDHRYVLSDLVLP